MSAADAVVLMHFAFVVYVVAGGLATLRWPWHAWLHLPAVAWGALVEFADLPCPLTALEGALRDTTGDGDFLARLLLPILYPDLTYPGVLTPPVRIALGGGVLAVNAAVYGYAFTRRRRRAAGRAPSPCARDCPRSARSR